MKKITHTLLAIAGLLALGSCNDTPMPPKEAPISFAQYPPYKLNVSHIDIVDEYQSPMHAPNVEHLLPYSPSEAMHIWVADRLRAVGMEKTLQVIIKDASVVAVDLPKKKGVTGFFTDEQDKRYDATLDVEMRIYGDDPLSEANIDVSATRSVSVDEKASVTKRNAITQKLVDDLMTDINSELDQHIQTYFANYLNNNPGH